MAGRVESFSELLSQQKSEFGSMNAVCEVPYHGQVKRQEIAGQIK